MRKSRKDAPRPRVTPGTIIKYLSLLVQYGHRGATASKFREKLPVRDYNHHLQLLREKGFIGSVVEGRNESLAAGAARPNGSWQKRHFVTQMGGVYLRLQAERLRGEAARLDELATQVEDWAALQATEAEDAPGPSPAMQPLDEGFETHPPGDA